MYWVGLGCIFERGNALDDSSKRTVYDSFEAALEVNSFPNPTFDPYLYCRSLNLQRLTLESSFRG